MKPKFECILDSISLGTMPDWISVLFTGLTLLIAYKALRTWVEEKEYDLHIDALAKSREAIDMIVSLRLPLFFSGEIDKELRDEVLERMGELDSYDEQILTFNSRLKSHRKLYDELLQLRERIWATYGKNHIFYTFYDRIINIIGSIRTLHYEYKIEGTATGADRNEERLREIRTIIFSLPGDTIPDELDVLHKQLITLRRRK